MSIGAKIKQLREAKHWTQHELAREASLTRSHISLIENNKIPNPGVEAIVKLAKALQVSEDILFEAAGIKVQRPPTTDLIAAAIDDLELRKWFTAENINSLPVDTKKAIAAIIRGVIEDRQQNQNLTD